MFCYQCQEATNGIACMSKAGYCGKTEETADLQDMLVFICKGLSIMASDARQKGIENAEVNRYVFDSLFVTITNANFDSVAILDRIRDGFSLKDSFRKELAQKGIIYGHDAQEYIIWQSDNELEIKQKSREIGVKDTENEDVRSLRELIIYGVKGLAAYTEHAYNLGYENPELYAFMQRALAATTKDLRVDELIALTMETGKFGVDVMALLDKAHTESYGHPEITKVNIGVRNNPAILISGHDLKDLETLLDQTEGSGVDVYTHSEMLPGHYYPKFKKYEHFVGNYGSSWWHQTCEFESFNGPILFTTNCLVPPKKSTSYMDRMYTTGATGMPGAKHISAVTADGKKDFSEIIEHAKRLAPPTELEQGEIVGGFAHNQALALADKVVDAVKSGAIKKFFVMAGCDGRMKSREYYTTFANKLPKDTVILTAGCAKYRYNKLPLGDIGGIPRVLDAGQCNDSYSLAVIALKLKEVFEVNDINELPIAYNIAWYEQKAVIVLLALLFLGVKNIHLGPTLPAFLSPNVAKVLVEQFGIAKIGNVEDDIKLFMS